MGGCFVADLAFKEVSDVSNCRIALFCEQSITVGCPTIQVLMSVAGEQLFFWTAAIAAPPERKAGLAARRAVCDPSSVRCPDRRLVLPILISQACQCVALKGERPDIWIIFPDREGDLLPIGRNAGAFESTRGEGQRLRITVSVDPYQRASHAFQASRQVHECPVR